jgi:hypothetical protein
MESECVILNKWNRASRVILASVVLSLLTFVGTSLAADENPFAQSVNSNPSPAPVVASNVENPFDLVALEDYMGRFTGGDVQLQLRADGKTLKGNLVFRGKKFTATGQLVNGVFEGKYSDGTDSWTFGMKREDGQMAFTADDFTAKLKRLKMPLLKGVYRSDRLQMQIDGSAGKYTGTIKFSEKEFPFTGSVLADQLEGTFTSGASTFPFVVTLERGGLGFNSSSFSEILKPESGSAPLPEEVDKAAEEAKRKDRELEQTRQELQRVQEEQRQEQIRAAQARATAAAYNAGSDDCFIATAAYGHSMETHVLKLRLFRERYLLSNTAGRFLVKTYYRISPPIADFIRTSDPLKSAVRTGLCPVVWAAGAMLGNPGDAMKLALFGLILWFGYRAVRVLQRLRLQRQASSAKKSDAK